MYYVLKAIGDVVHIKFIKKNDTRRRDARLMTHGRRYEVYGEQCAYVVKQSPGSRSNF